MILSITNCFAYFRSSGVLYQYYPSFWHLVNAVMYDACNMQTYIADKSHYMESSLQKDSLSDTVL